MERTSACQPESGLSENLRQAAVREHGITPELLPLIGNDPELFRAFYAEHVTDVQRFVARRVGDRERVADLTGDIFLAVIDAAPRYRGGGTPRAWLYGIARTVVAEDRRRTGREHVREERLRASILLDEAESARIEERIEAAARSRELYEAMDRLPTAERAVLELVAIDELSVTEAAVATGVRPVTARVRLHRAKRRLRAALGDGVRKTDPV